MVPAVMQRIAGSPDLFGADTWRSVNFVTAHDGLTLHDLTAVTSDRHRSWDSGPELRLQQLKNAFAFLLLSAGAPMFVMGDEFARTQHGHDNPYDLDSDLNWVDWDRLPRWAELHSCVRSLIALRAAHVRGREPRFHGAAGAPDTTAESRSVAWCFGGELYVMANMWWSSVDFAVQEPGAWRIVVSTAPQVDVASVSAPVRVPPRAIVVLTREPARLEGERG
jgi:glycogen operon protein